ncbi:MAG: tetratricopeptide repeat protein [Saprospiraceae bacterium]|nr:tetratricopeptide repeat protein [Saprospiraceae bacterium]
MRFLITTILICLSINLNGQALSIMDSIELLLGEEVITKVDTHMLSLPDYERAEKLSKAIQYTEGEYKAVMLRAIDTMHAGEIPISLENFQRGFILATSMNDTSKMAIALKYIGTSHLKAEDYVKAIDYYNKGLVLLEGDKTNRLWGDLHNNIGAAYLRMELGDSAMVHFHKALANFEHNESDIGKFYILGNMGVYHLDLEEPTKAIQYFFQMERMEMFQKDHMKRGLTFLNLGKAYLKLGQFDKALNYLEKGLAIHKANNFKIHEYSAYNHLADYYETVNENKKALTFYRKFHNLRDSINSSENLEHLATLEAKYEMLKNENALLANEQEIGSLKQSQKISRLWMGIVMSVLLGLTIIGFLLFYRSRLKRLELTIENEEALQKTLFLKDQLETKTQDLTNFALDIKRRNEIAEKLFNSINRMERFLSPKAKEEFKNIRSLVNTQTQVNEGLSFFQDNIDQVNSEFFSLLRERFADLSQSELELCGMLRLNLSTKEIANLRNVTPKSVQMARYRLRKKMDLEAGEDVSSYLMDLMAQKVE